MGALLMAAILGTRKSSDIVGSGRTRAGFVSR